MENKAMIVIDTVGKLKIEIHGYMFDYTGNCGPFLNTMSFLSNSIWISLLSHENCNNQKKSDDCFGTICIVQSDMQI